MLTAPTTAPSHTLTYSSGSGSGLGSGSGSGSGLGSGSGSGSGLGSGSGYYDDEELEEDYLDFLLSNDTEATYDDYAGANFTAAEIADATAMNETLTETVVDYVPTPPPPPPPVPAPSGWIPEQWQFRIGSDPRVSAVLPLNASTDMIKAELELLLEAKCTWTEDTSQSFYDLDTFEGGPGSSDDWTSRDDHDPVVTYDREAHCGRYSLYMQDTNSRGGTWGRNFEGNTYENDGIQSSAGYNTNDYKYM